MSRPSSDHSRPEGKPQTTCWLTCSRVMQHARIRPLCHTCCKNRRTKMTEKTPRQNKLWKQQTIASRIRSKRKTGTFCPKRNKRSLPFRPNSRPSRDWHPRKETELPKRVPTDIKRLPRRKPLIGSQRPSPNGSTKKLNQTTSLKPGSGKEIIGTGE